MFFTEKVSLLNRQTTAAEQNNYLMNILGGPGCVGIFRLHCDDAGAGPIDARQTILPVSGLHDYNFFQPQECVALNTFSTASSRTADNLLSLNALYLDLDIYNVPGLSIESALGMLEEYEYGYGIPKPSYVISSGQGAYLIWLLDRCEATQANKALWFAVIGELYQRTRKFGCDPKCRDIVRVLRVPGSINSKHGVNAEVRVLTDNSHLRYNLDHIAASLKISSDQPSRRYPYPSPLPHSEKQDRQGPICARAVANTFVRQGLLMCSRKVANMRAQDIEVVLILQGLDAVGHREVALFYYRHFLEQKGCAPERALELTLLLNRKLTAPLSEKEVVSATKTREGACYCPSNETLISELGITSEIECELKTILTPAGRAQKRRLKSGRQISRAEETAQKKCKIAELRSEGKTVAEVCRVMGFSKTTYYNLTRGSRRATKEKVPQDSSPAVSQSVTPVDSTIALPQAVKSNETVPPSMGMDMVHLLSDNYIHIGTHERTTGGSGGRRHWFSRVIACSGGKAARGMVALSETEQPHMLSRSGRSPPNRKLYRRYSESEEKHVRLRAEE